jgi:hypothetical protein
VTRNGEIIYSRPHKKSTIEIKERLLGPQVKINVGGKEKHTAKVSYYKGSDPSQWHTNLPSYGRVGLGRMAPGIRVELKAHGHNVEKLFYLSPGADPTRIRLAVEGAQALKVNPGGELELATPAGAMRFTKPVAYQQIDGKNRNVTVRYHRIGPHSYGFELGDYDSARELVIDPLVQMFPLNAEYPESSAMLNVAADATGNIYSAGYHGNKLAIIKLDSLLETLLGASYIENSGGGTRADYENDIIRALALDKQGNVFVAGGTENRDFPVTPGGYDTDIVDGNRFGHVSNYGFVTK